LQKQWQTNGLNKMKNKDESNPNQTGLFDKDGKELNVTSVMAMLPSLIPLESVTRVEVIDHTGRGYVNWKPKNKTEISLQNSGKTLKVFIFADN